MSSEFKIELATAENGDRILKFLQEHFYRGEPLNDYLYEESKGQLDTSKRGHYHVNKVPEGLSFIAVNSSNEIVGAVINKHLKGLTYIEKSLLIGNQSLQKIASVMEIFEQQIAEIEEPLKNDEKRMSIEVISVNPDWRNKGLASVLTDRTIKFAKENGFSQIRAICTSYYSTKLFEKFGFHCIHSMKYEDYKINGEVVFKIPPPHTHVNCMLLKLE